MAFKFVIMFYAFIAYAQAGGLYAPGTIAVDAVADTHQNVVRSFDGTVSSYSKAVDTPFSSVRKMDSRINNNVYSPAIAKSISYDLPTAHAAYHQASNVYATKAYAPVAHKTLLPAPVVEKSVEIAPAVTTYGHPVYGYTAPAVTHAKNIAYTAQAAPVLTKNVYSAPTVTYAAQAPVLAKSVYSAPTATYADQAPLLAKSVYSAPTVTYTAPAPTVAKTVSYAAPDPVTYSAPVATTNVNQGLDATTYTHNAPGVTGYGSSQRVHYSPASAVSHMSFDGFGTHWGF